ncbi:SDR family oxidoreductase [Halostella sp. PRR32]|uniref:SDR family oxidoreductase n=1 Tax=Halostella sp. PRR32 TaxID=3098147 RepID=UPI002B1E481B|nr:SDR family oxidoreductase [Halostella sp. PRR32]
MASEDVDESDAVVDESITREETVLITGCSSGIGRATAKIFLDEGWRVYATSRDITDVTDLAEAGCQTAALDVTDDDQIAAVVEEIIDDWGRIDCLVNNAGYAQMGPVEDVSVEDVHSQFDVNVYGPHRLARQVLPHMREQGDGTIVNLSSLAGRVSYPGNGVYCGSKFALEAMSDALRAEVSSFDVDVVLVEPGPVETNFSKRVEDEVDTLERTSAYDSLYRILDDTEAIGGGGPAAVPPRRVAEVILNAASSTEPAARYPVGPFANFFAYAGVLPAKWRDAAYRLVSKLAGVRS